MSGAVLVRSGRLVAETLASTSWSSSPLCIGSRQIRSYAQKAKAPAKKGSAGFRLKQKDAALGSKPKKGQQSGVFFPMNLNQLEEPIFRPDYRVELKLPLFSPEAITENAVGKAMAFPMSENEAIRAYGVPKNMLLEFRILSKPCSVVRDVTLAAVNTLDYASDKSSKDTRLILTGPSGCGKSYLLLQAVEYAVHNNWIVLYIPRAVNLVNSSTAYAYDARTRTYLQPDYSYELLRRFLSVNSAALHDLTLQEDVVLEDRTVPAGTLLADLVRLGVDRKELSAVVLPTLMEALSRQTTYPVFLAVDDVQSLFCATKYRDPHYRTIMPHHLAIPRLILEYASGKKTFARGAFFGAESTADTRFLMPLELREALGLPEHRPVGPYVARRPEVAEYAAGLRNVAVPAQLSVGEAAALFEVWMEDQALHSGEARSGDSHELLPKPNDELFMAKYSEAGGNARAFMWKGLLATLSSL